MTDRARMLAGLTAFVLGTVITAWTLVGTTATLGAAAEVKVAGIIVEWSAEKVKVKDSSGKVHEFKMDRTTRMEGQPKEGASVEVVALREGPLAIRVKVLPPPPPPTRTVVGVIKQRSSEKIILEVSGKMMEFKHERGIIDPDWLVGQKVHVTYHDVPDPIKVATKVVVAK